MRYSGGEELALCVTTSHALSHSEFKPDSPMGALVGYLENLNTESCLLYLYPD